MVPELVEGIKKRISFHGLPLGCKPAKATHQEIWLFNPFDKLRDRYNEKDILIICIRDLRLLLRDRYNDMDILINCPGTCATFLGTDTLKGIFKFC